MNFFSKFFAKKSAVDQIQTSPRVPVDLFTDTVPPAQVSVADTEKQSRESRRSFRPTAVREFLDHNYWQLGYEHAVQFPVQERRTTALTRIRTDYRQALQQALQFLNSEKETHAQEMLLVGGVSNVLDTQMQRRAEELESLGKTLQSQLELSVDDEGWIAPVLAAYNDGFQVGAFEYARINDLLGGLTTLK